MSQADIHADRILIVDFGSQYTQLIARRIREIGVYCEIHPWDMSDQDVRDFQPGGIVLSGGPESVIEGESPVAPEAVFSLGVPVLGICYGMQTMAAQLGGKVENADHHEYGYARVRARGHTRLLVDIEDETSPEGYGLLDVWMSHGDRVIEMPEGFIVMASTDNAPIAGMADESRRFYGVQFHPEVTHTRQGGRILERFVREIRKIGLELGLPSEMVYRHPFPGPGLGVRIALRAVETIDFMTARWSHLPYDFLDLVSRRIINEIPGISRVTHDISGKPPATIEWE